MPVTLPYPVLDAAFTITGGASIPVFAPSTVHNDANHNNPHAKLLANDQALKTAVDAVEASMLGPLQNFHIGTKVTSGYFHQYAYIRPYTPISLSISSGLYAPASSRSIIWAKWLDTIGNTLVDWKVIIGINQVGAGDGGAGLNDTFYATVPFFPGTVYINFQISGANVTDSAPSGVPAFGWAANSYLHIISVLEQT